MKFFSYHSEFENEYEKFISKNENEQKKIDLTRKFFPVVVGDVFCCCCYCRYRCESIHKFL